MRIFALPLLLGVLGGPCVALAGATEEGHIGQLLRQASLQGLNGPPRQLSDFRGRPLIINVCASWCGPCRAEIASPEPLPWRADRRDFAIHRLSTDECTWH